MRLLLSNTRLKETVVKIQKRLSELYKNLQKIGKSSSTKLPFLGAFFRPVWTPLPVAFVVAGNLR